MCLLAKSSSFCLIFSFKTCKSLLIVNDLILKTGSDKIRSCNCLLLTTSKIISLLLTSNLTDGNEIDCLVLVDISSILVINSFSLKLYSLTKPSYLSFNCFGTPSSLIICASTMLALVNNEKVVGINKCVGF